MYILILFLPIFSFILASVFGYKLGKNGVIIVTNSLLFLTFLDALFIFYEVVFCGNKVLLEIISWVDLGILSFSWSLLFDTITVVMLVVVTSISLLVHLYSVSYMGEDPHFNRFMSYLSLFTFFMLSLVTADNLIQLFFGWEGVGLASYLLINFWYTRIQANKGAIKAVIVNRVGDFGLSLGIFGIFFICGSLDFNVILLVLPNLLWEKFNFLNFEVYGITFIALCFFIGVIGKSAQLGLHTWLPDAMEGPTPVSALIHAATMVTAGVFLLIRCSYVFEGSQMMLFIITIFGGLTAFFAATTGLLQNDLKRVIAYSTCSQLGYMVFVCGLSSYNVAMYHLMTHAFFKALLFLSAGGIIHSLMDEQDMRKMGGLIKLLPFTYISIFVGSMSLMGFPFLSGFYSKDLIIEIAFGSYTLDGLFVYTLGVLSAFFTAFYSFRLIYLVFISEIRMDKPVLLQVHEVSFIMVFIFFVLGLGAIFIGYLSKDMFVGLGSNFWDGSIFYNVFLHDLFILDAEFGLSFLKLLPVFLSLFGGLFCYYLNNFYSEILYKFILSNIGRNLYIYFNRKWFFDILYNGLIVKNILKFSYLVTYKYIDRGLIEIFGPTMLFRLVINLKKEVIKLQTGFLYNYGFGFILGLLGMYLLFLMGIFWDLLLLFFLAFFIIKEKKKVLKI